MKQALYIVQIVVSILLIVVILLQQSGSGLGATFGGEGNVYRTKRGAEKFIFTATIVLAAVFLLTSLLNIIL